MRCTKSFDQATVTNASLELLRVFPVNWTTFPNAPVHLEAYLSKMRGRQLELLQFQSLIKQHTKLTSNVHSQTHILVTLLHVYGLYNFYILHLISKGLFLKMEACLPHN